MNLDEKTKNIIMLTAIGLSFFATMVSVAVKKTTYIQVKCEQQELSKKSGSI